MNITRAAIENDRVTFVALIIVIIGGLFAFFNLPRDYDPGFTIRVAQVVSYFPGASPQRVEQLVTDKLEKAIQEIPELDYVESRSKNGVSVIFVHIREEYTKMRPIWDDLRRKVAGTEPDLPDAVIGPFVNDEFGDVFGIIISLTGEGFSYAELKTVADAVRNELLLIQDVAKVAIYGEQAERIFVEYRNATLAELGLSPYQLTRILESRNIIIPGGEITVGGERIVLEPSGNFESVDQMRRAVISVPGRQELLYLGDIVTIRRGYIDPPRSRMRTNGKPSLALAISMREEGNLIALGEQVEKRIRQLEAQYPYGIEFSESHFLPKEVNAKVKEFRNNLLQAILVVIGVMLITLGVRTGLLVATLIPMAMLMALLIMFFSDIGLDQVSLAALIIALGMLVDNAIVMSESIMVQMAEGKAPVQAAVDSARELIIPLLTSSLTTAAAFLPIFLAESNTGEYTAPLFKVVTITLLSSWLLALTLIPLFCVRFIKPKKKDLRENGYNSRFYRLYRWGLLKALRHRFLLISLVAAVFAGAIWSSRYLPVIFFPPSDRAYFKAEFELPPGTDIRTTADTIGRVERFIEKALRVGGDEGRKKGVDHWISYIGEGGPRFILQHTPEIASPEYTLMVVTTTGPDIIDSVISRLKTHVTRHYPELSLTVKKIQNGPPVDHPIEVRIMGREIPCLFEIVDAVKTRLRSFNATRNISDDWGRWTKKIRVAVNQPRARRAGVSSQDIAISLQTGLSGFELSEYREADKLIPIMLRSVAADRQDLGKLEGLNVYVQSTGRSVPLRQVADLKVQWQPSEIIRKNRLKTVTVSSDLAPGMTAHPINRALIPWLEAQKSSWGPGYRYEIGGEAETSAEANRSILVKVPYAGFIIIMLLVFQFNSIRRPLIVLVTIPLGFIGVILGLLAARLYFGFMTLLGIVSLSGIVINNAIVLLERIHLEMHENGLDPPRAIVEAAQRRMRPILLTTATTAFGMVPLYLGGGAMWEPLAMAIIAGILFATLLTLGVVPVLYALFFRVRFKGFVYSPR